MGLKEKFVAFSELQIAAMEEKFIKPTYHPDVIAAFDKANTYKREILKMIDEIERPKETDPIDRNYKGFEKQERYYEYMLRKIKEEDLT